MLKNTINYLLVNKNTLRKCMSTTAAPKEKWDLMAGVLVERLPRLTKTLQPLQKEVQVF
jgi:large subunit ribosomal protein L46